MRSAVVLAILLSASAAAAQAPAVIDASHARELGLDAHERTLPIAADASLETSLTRFLAKAEREGASYVGRLTWVWTERDPWGFVSCQAPLALVVTQPAWRRHWRVVVGRETCVPARAQGASAIRGQLYSRPRVAAGMSRAQIRALAEQLEPPSPRARTRRRVSPGLRRARQREIRALAEQLE